MAQSQRESADPRDAREVEQKKILNRLKRARGQLDAIIRAIEEERECRDVVTQIAAVNSAIQRAGFAVISRSMRECLSENDAEGTQELENLFLSLS